MTETKEVIDNLLVETKESIDFLLRRIDYFSLLLCSVHYLFAVVTTVKMYFPCDF